MRYVIFVLLVISICSCSGVTKTAIRQPEPVVHQPDTSPSGSQGLREKTSGTPRILKLHSQAEPGNRVEDFHTGYGSKDSHTGYGNEISTNFLYSHADGWNQISTKYESGTDTDDNCECQDLTEKVNSMTDEDTSESSSDDRSDLKFDLNVIGLVSNFEKVPPDLQFYSKYSKKLGINFEGSENKQLIMAVDEWLGTRYRWGGCSKYGTDCSCLVKTIYKDVYGIELSRSSASIFYNDLKPVKKEDLQEGDLLFFKIRRNRISHVGLYLKDNKFAHASLHRGVVIDDLTKKYYRKRFFSGGRPAGKVKSAMRLKIED